MGFDTVTRRLVGLRVRLSLRPLTLARAHFLSRSGYDPRDQRNFFNGELAFLALYPGSFSATELLAIRSDVTSYRQIYATNSSTDVNMPIVTVNSSSTLADAVNNAFVVNFTLASTAVQYTKSWYIYR